MIAGGSYGFTHANKSSTVKRNMANDCFIKLKFNIIGYKWNNGSEQ